MLSAHMNLDGSSCFPTVATISQETGLSKKCVITNLQKAEASGWIKKGVLGRRGRGGQKHHKYTPIIPTVLVNEVHQDKVCIGELDDHDLVNEVHPSSSVSKKRKEKKEKKEKKKPYRVNDPDTGENIIHGAFRAFKISCGVEYRHPVRARAKLPLPTLTPHPSKPLTFGG